MDQLGSTRIISNHARLLTRRKELKEKKCFSTYSLDYHIQQLNRAIREGPYYICVVCKDFYTGKPFWNLRRINTNPVLVYLQVLLYLISWKSAPTFKDTSFQKGCRALFNFRFQVMASFAKRNVCIDNIKL